MSEDNLAKGSEVLLNVNGIQATFIREENAYGLHNEAYKPQYVFEVTMTPDEYRDMIYGKSGGKRRIRKSKKNRRRKSRRY
jgi:hypothetical protein